MSDNLTAHEKLEDAVKEILIASGHDDGLVVDWVLVVAQHIPGAEGNNATGTGIYGPHDQPTYRAAGLIGYAKAIIDRKLAW